MGCRIARTRGRRWYSRRRLLWTVAVLAALLLIHRFQPPRRESRPGLPHEGVYVVARVVDGDTLLLADGMRVRLIGADAPESVRPNHPVEPFALEAAAYTRSLVEQGSGQVRLVFDQQRYDRFGRCLAYVYVGESLLNEELIRAGLARAETRFHYDSAMKTRFVQAQKEAQNARRGMWAATGSL